MKKTKRAVRKLTSIVLALVMCAACFSYYGITRTSAAPNVELTFNSASAMNHFAAANNLNVSYSEAEESVMMAATGGGDPYVLLNVEGAASISADTYKYVVVTYRTPTTNSSTASQTELFMSAGSITAPTANHSVKFNPTNGHKYRSEIVDMRSDASWSGTVHSIRFDAFMNASAWDCFYLASVTFCSDSASAQSAATAKASEANGDLDVYSESELDLRSYDLGLYTQRFWKGNIVFNESYFPLCNADGTIPPASMMFDVKRIVSVKNAALTTEYKYGVDYTVTADGKFQVLSTGSIPKVAYSSFYSATNPNNSSWWPLNNGGYTFFSEGSAFHNAQLAITYTHDDIWDGFVPDSKTDQLPGTYSKLQNKQHITAVFFGDSITFGCNASGLSSVNAAPHMPLWADMTIAGLKAKYDYNDISYINTAVGGMMSDWGAQQAQTRVASYNPDLVFIGFGMNDGSSGVSTADFESNIRSIINTTRNANPNCEFILVASIVANPETNVAGCQEDYLPVLNRIANDYTGVAVADVMSSHKALLNIKKYSDMTGNNVNHPNDFIIRYYAQTMLTTLSPSDIVEARTDAIRALTGYVSLNDYRPAEQQQIQSIIATGTANINAAATPADVRAALSAAKALIDELKTDLEYQVENIDYTNLLFNNTAVLDLTVSALNSVTATTNAATGVTTYTSTGGDPNFTVNYEPGNISADTYKYVTIVYSVPSSVTNTTTTQIFFTAGSNTSPSEANSLKFNAEKGGYVYKVIDLTSASYWTGKIHNIRIDPFASFVSGDCFTIHSISLFTSASDAAAYGGRTVDILSGNYLGRSESVQFDTESEVGRLSAVGGIQHYGDVNGDGAVNARDVAAIKSLLVCIFTPGFNEDLADVNHDGLITVKDLLLVKKTVAGSIPGETTGGGNSVSIYYDTEEKGAMLDADSDQGAVLIDLADKDISTEDDYSCMALIYKNPTEAAIPATVSLMRNGSEVANSSISFTAAISDQYVSKLIDFSSVSGWSGDIDTVKLSFGGSELILGGVIVGDNAPCTTNKGSTKALSLNRMNGDYTPVTGQTVVPLNGTTTMATYANYNGASNGTYTYPSALTFTLDRQPDDKFDRITLRYTSTTAARGVITYNMGGASVTDEFFLEASNAEATFSTLVPGYLNDSVVSEVASVTVYPLKASSSTFSLKGITTEDVTNYDSSEIYLQNDHVKVGVLLTMGGGISYYEELDDNNPNYSNLLNRHDVGRLIQQSYYGINGAPYVMGMMGTTPWGYNPVQGGDVHNNASQLVDLQVTDTTIYVKARPMDWGHDGHLTPSYMENWYTLVDATGTSDSFLKVDNRFVDFSPYTHTLRNQELPAFYTVSALGTFCLYRGNSPWTGGAYTAYSNLRFWGASKQNHDNQTYNASSEGWYAWIDGSGFGVGLYVPNVTEVLAGRFFGADGDTIPANYTPSYDPDDNTTNYFAPHRDMTLKFGKPLTYSYFICAGQINSIRETFKNNRTLINNSALLTY